MADELYPYKGFRFKVEIGGTMVAGFSEVTGFDATIDVTEYREGDAVDNTPKKIPGLIKYSNIVFKRGLVDSVEFFTWLDDIHNGKINDNRKAVSIKLMGEDNKPVTEWTLLRAWPCKYTGPELKGMSSDVAIESIEFAHEGLARKSAK